ncbi:hypothetical protein H2199_006644 [Coniosporium tulheliwenetii]|uniref:Uncharacterized protein n=1 Tax=Coniosporium tulheliwenetii TaxID=3383036 RepID=A0ACC2YUC8_9PEZI|nr:hypothetical protein H2199_006644 [Cladosporium sp. JES 115]
MGGSRDDPTHGLLPAVETRACGVAARRIRSLTSDERGSKAGEVVGLATIKIRKERFAKITQLSLSLVTHCRYTDSPSRNKSSTIAILYTVLPVRYPSESPPLAFPHLSDNIQYATHPPQRPPPPSPPHPHDRGIPLRIQIRLRPRNTVLSRTCAAVYTQPIPSCTPSDFHDPAACSASCMDGVLEIQSLVQTACADDAVPGNTVIGFFLAGRALEAVCPPAATDTDTETPPVATVIQSVPNNPGPTIGSSTLRLSEVTSSATGLLVETSPSPPLHRNYIGDFHTSDDHSNTDDYNYRITTRGEQHDSRAGRYRCRFFTANEYE